VASPPTGRKAGPNVGPVSNGDSRRIAGYRTFRDDADPIDELVWPLSIDTYSIMDTDGQVTALLRLIDWAVRNYQFELHPGDLSGTLLDKLAQDTHLPIAGQPVDDEHAARTARVHRRRLLRDILRALSIGHSVFEIVGEYDDDRTWRIIDLSHLNPRSLDRWHFGNDNRVEQIDQWHGVPPTELHAGRLAVFRLDPSHDHPYGESMLRPLYTDWVSKDRAIRVNLLSIERHGMGIPTVEMSDEAQAKHQQDYLDIVTGVAAGEETGVVIPAGASFDIKGMDGTLPDTLATIRYHDEAMSRTMQGQVAQLGQTDNGSGSYALSRTLDNILDIARDTIAGWIAEAITEQIVARWCEYNAVELSRMPRVDWARPEPDPVALQPADMVALVNAGLVNPAQLEVREHVARTYGLPAPDATPLPAARDRERPQLSGPRQLAAAPEPPADPGVGHRHLNEPERRARVLFAQVADAWDTAVDATSAVYQDLRDRLIAAAADEIADSDLLDDLATLAPDLRDRLLDAIPDDLVERAADLLDDAARTGATQVADEFARQGADDADPGDPDYRGRATEEAGLVAGALAMVTADQALGIVARRRGPDVTPDELADAIRDELADLTTAHTDDLARGGVTRAQHTGRTATIRAHESDVVGIYASELLDSNTCTECSHVDGTEYPDLDAALADYPTGGYRACAGGDRCRGTLVAIHAAEQEVSVQ